MRFCSGDIPCMDSDWLNSQPIRNVPKDYCRKLTHLRHNEEMKKDER